MHKISLGLALSTILFLATAARGDQLAAVGVYCVSVELSRTPQRALRVGERPPQLSFVVSNRSEIEDERKHYTVAPLNDEVFRALVPLVRDARVCLSASRMTVRHGLDILLAWRVETCVDFECTNVRGYDGFVPDVKRDNPTGAGPPRSDMSPSNRE